MSEIINVRVPDGAKQQLKEQGSEAGYETLTDYIRACLSVEPAPASPPNPLLKATPLGRNILQTRVSPEEKKAFNEMCKTEGVKPAQALRRQVRIALRNGPDFCKDELLLLRHANMQLVAIGRNLNQVTRKINQDEGDVSQRLLADLQTTIDAHRGTLAKLTSRSTRRAAE